MPLTSTQIASLKPAPKAYSRAVGDGLQLIVHPTGKMVWSLFYRRKTMPDGSPGDFKARRYTIGTIKEFTLTQAREEVVKLLGDIARGRDPAGERKQARKDAETRISTVTEAIDRFIADFEGGAERRTWPEMQRCLRKYVGGRIGKEPLHGLTRRQIKDLLRVVKYEHGGPQANRVLSCLKTMFRWLKDEEHIREDPCASVARPAKEQSRARKLSDHELRTIWKASFRLRDPYGQVVRLMIVTGQRRCECTRMEWPEIDPAERLWLIPASKMKMKVDHVVPLPQAVLDMLDSLPVTGEYVFSVRKSRDDKRNMPIKGYNALKVSLDVAVLDVLREGAAVRGNDPAKVEPLPRWTFHDFRRTQRSTMPKLRVPTEIAELLIAHAKRGMERVYNVYEYIEERREAMELWAKHLDAIVNPKPALAVMAPTLEPATEVA